MTDALPLRAARAIGRRARAASIAASSRARSALGLANPKIFVVGRNKTGTTSMAEALRGLGYRIGVQRTAELLAEDWGVRDFRALIAYCHTADAFQDIPFSLPHTAQAVDAAFPGSKFILTVRGSADEWVRSYVRFHTKRLAASLGVRGTPSLDDLRADTYIAPGRLLRIRELQGIPLDEPFPEEALKSYYLRHNEWVQDYFRNRPDDLLTLDLAEPDAMERLCAFLGRPFRGEAMPVLNRSR